MFLCRSLEVESVSGVGHSLGCSRSECGDAHVVLLEAGEVLRERLDARGAEEDEHVAVELGCFFLGEVVAHGAVHDALGVVEFLRVEQLLYVVVVNAAHWHEIFLALVLHHCGDERVELAGVAEEHLALAILHILLYVECDCLCYAEVLHVLGDSDSHLLSEFEVVVDSVARGEHHRCEIEKTYLLLSEFFWAEPFYFDERTKDEFHAEVLCDVEVRRLFA